VLDNIATELKHGNFKPLANYVLIGSLMGVGVTDIKDLIKGKPLRGWPRNTKETFARIAENLMAVGGIGLVIDALNSTQYAKWGGGYVLSVFGGPTVGDLEKGMSWAIKKGVPAVIERSPKKGAEALKAIGQTALKTVPFAGRRLQQEILPYKKKKTYKKSKIY